MVCWAQWSLLSQVMLCVILMKNTRCDRTTASVLARSANDAANLEMGLANDAARLRTASVRQDQRKCLLTSSVRQNERHLSAIERHQPTPLRVFLPVLPTTLALLL